MRFFFLKGISQVQKALVERLRILEHEKSRIEREGEQQRKQYEKCLDDVAKQVVKAVLSQKVRLVIYHTQFYYFLFNDLFRQYVNRIFLNNSLL